MPGAKRPRTTSSGPRRAMASQAERFRSARAAHADETAEDYAEAIADLIARDGAARVTSLAACLGVSHVTVIRALARLSRAGLVVVKPYKGVALTLAGRALAARSKHRHGVVLAFLRALGVPARVAETDAEGLEHHVSPATLRAMERFVKR